MNRLKRMVPSALDALCAWIVFVPGLNAMTKDFGMPILLAGALAFLAVLGIFTLTERLGGTR